MLDKPQLSTNINADSGPRGLCVVAVTNKFTRTAEVLWRKRGGTAALCVRGRAPTPAGTGFIAFLGTLHEEGPHLPCTGSL